MKNLVVTSDNFTLVAAKYYNDIAATDQDFQDDIRRFFLIKRLLNQYKRTGELKERLILNHLTIILNVFEDAAITLLFHELQDYLSQIVVFLILLNRLPDRVGDIVTTKIPMDTKVVECLRTRIK